MTSNSPASSPELPHRLHRLKTDPEVYQAVLSGRKTFEIRLNDRDFRVGDELLLMETTVTGEAIRAGAPLQFTGNELRKRISHVLSGYGLMPEWVCLSFEAGSAAAAQAVPEGFWLAPDDLDQSMMVAANRQYRDNTTCTARDLFQAVRADWISRNGRSTAPTQGAEGAAPQAVDDAFAALRALTEAVLTRADNDYLRRQLDAAVKVMAARGCEPPVPWPDADFFVSRCAPSPTPTAPQEADALREALTELIALKDMKERIELIRAGYTFMTDAQDAADSLEQEYGARKPLAWAVARAALAQHQPQQGEQR